MHRPVEKLGKVGNTVWGKNRSGQICYTLVSPANPRTAPQQANRHHFGSLGPRWSLLLTHANRVLWEADARHYRTHGRPGRSAPMIGFLRYMSVNAKRAHQGLPPLDVPPWALSPEPVAFPPSTPAPSPGLRHRSDTARVPVGYRTATVATRLAHRWPLLDPRRPPVHARAGPGPPLRLRFPSSFSALGSPTHPRATIPEAEQRPFTG